MNKQLPAQEPLPPPPWQAGVQAELDRQAEALDAVAQSRLNRARQAALAQLEKSPVPLPLWGGALATAVAGAWLVLTLWFGTDAELEILPDTGTTDGELLAEQVEPEFFNELEFYSWLAEEGLESPVEEDAHGA